MMPKTVMLPKSIRFGGTHLSRYQHTGEAPEPDGVRRVNDSCVELESYANLEYGGSASFIGMAFVTGMIALAIALYILGRERLTYEILVSLASCSQLLVAIALLFYYTGGAHRTRGAYIRVHRKTRKIYYVEPRGKTVHVLEWDQLEALAGHIANVAGSGYSTRHPLYLIGVDYGMQPPTQICIACGNSGAFHRARSAKALWSYLQVFMEQGPAGLPQPAPLPPKLSRREAVLQPYREWFAFLRRRLKKEDGWIFAPFTIPMSFVGLLFEAFPESVEAFLQYNVPYAKFPKEIDRLCGFEEKRKPVIRVNGERIEL